MEDKIDAAEEIGNYRMHKCRSIVAQILAAASSAIVMFNVAVMYSAIIVVNGALTKSKNKDETFTITGDESTWYGSLIHLTHLIGSIIAGLVQDSFGRKKCMLLCNIPQVAGWITLFYADTPFYLYTSSILMGFGASLGEVTTVTYISETASPKLRGRLFSFTKIGYGFGALFVFVFNIYLQWRILALICLIGPVINLCYLIIMPETPSWLLSKGRPEDALKSLRWLRGWASVCVVTEEFQKLQVYIKESKNLGKKVGGYLPVALKKGEIEKDTICNEIWSNIMILRKKEFLEPYKIVATTFLLSYVLSLRVIKPYLIIILNEFELNAPKILAVSSVAQIIGALTMAATINRFGKKKLILYTFNVCALCLAAIGVYATLFKACHFRQAWLLYGICVTIFYLTGYTVGGMPWYICGEIYPQQIRGIASGISAMTGHLMLFVFVKLYGTLVTLLTTANLFLIYACIGVAGTLYLHLRLPETENKSLEEIEKSFQRRKEDGSVNLKATTKEDEYSGDGLPN